MGDDQQGPIASAPAHTFGTLHIELQDVLCWLVLDRPGKGNALNPQVLDEIDQVLAGQKAALNRVAALGGFWQAATTGIEMDAMHHFAGTGAPTTRAIREAGIAGALELFERGQLGGG